MKKMSLLIAAGVMLVGCSGMKESGCCVCVDALRVAALQSSAWNSAEWISVKGAPIAGAVLAWIYRRAAGIAVDPANPANPGFRNIIIAPEPIISSVDLI